MKTGERIVFGEFLWQVLEVLDSKALIITDKIIEQRSYHDKYVDITWADCSLREYLNTEILARFSEKEKERIVPIMNQNPDNPWFGTSGGVDTKDFIFIPSLREIACQYFGDSSTLLYHPREKQRYWYERKDANNYRRVAVDEEKNYWWYWIRTPGRHSVKAVYVFPDGNIGIHGNNIKVGNVADSLRWRMWLPLLSKLRDSGLFRLRKK